ncbi:hypothetical protein LSH36_73g06020 [Paralvinella palmiformis]|uniref:Uncharacterized protein n=1 Tax=Paralvinella palmiformis TaxID=53620 RepID=A0AAD9K3V4_9ANNE|nr:hypothetical protein LSH36_73g06020 [Paralvinella palmiformis]
MVSQLDEHRHDISQVVIVDVGIINNVLSVMNIMSNVELDYRYRRPEEDEVATTTGAYYGCTKGETLSISEADGRVRTPTAVTFSSAYGLAVLYYTDWKAVLQYVPIYGQKYGFEVPH